MTYGATTPDGIAYLTTGSSVNPVTESSTQASSVQTALSLRPFYNYVWANAAGRTGQTGMRAGDLGFQTDTGVAYQYVNSASGWASSPTGAGRIYTGSIQISSFTNVTTGNYIGWKGSATITFPTGYFSSTPIVQTTALTSAPWACATSTSSTSSTSTVVNLWRTDSGSSTTVNYLAIL